jgi:hypothetical protein
MYNLRAHLCVGACVRVYVCLRDTIKFLVGRLCIAYECSNVPQVTKPLGTPTVIYFGHM